VRAVPTLCVSCREPLPTESLRALDFFPCAVCATPQRVELFPALERPVSGPQPGEPVVVAGEATCYFHDDKRAAAACESCGLFVCRLCEIPVDGKSRCPKCVETGATTGKLPGLVAFRNRYSYSALWLVTVGLFMFFITAPLALYIGYKYRNEPKSLVRKDRGAMTLAMTLAVLELLGGVGLVVGVIWSFAAVMSRTR